MRLHPSSLVCLAGLSGSLSHCLYRRIFIQEHGTLHCFAHFSSPRTAAVFTAHSSVSMCSVSVLFPTHRNAVMRTPLLHTVVHVHCMLVEQTHTHTHTHIPTFAHVPVRPFPHTPTCVRQPFTACCFCGVPAAPLQAARRCLTWTAAASSPTPAPPTPSVKPSRRTLWTCRCGGRCCRCCRCRGFPLTCWFSFAAPRRATLRGAQPPQPADTPRPAAAAAPAATDASAGAASTAAATATPDDLLAQAAEAASSPGKLLWRGEHGVRSLRARACVWIVVSCIIPPACALYSHTPTCPRSSGVSLFLFMFLFFMKKKCPASPAARHRCACGTRWRFGGVARHTRVVGHKEAAGSCKRRP